VSATSRTSRVGGHFAHRDGSGAEALEREPGFFKRICMRQQARHVALVHVDDGGDEKHLTLDACLFALPLQPLVDEALVRGMLIDDDDAIAGLGHDVGVVQLGPRRAERGIEIRLRHGGFMRARVG
jgi:hypothetical protein